MSKKTEVSNNVEALKAEINARFEKRIASEIAKDKQQTALKFAKEQSAFTLAYAQVMHDHKISAEYIDTIAIYAMTKARQILHAIAHDSSASIDQNTKAIFSNAKRNSYKTLSSNQQNMCLSQDIKTRTDDPKEITLRDRRAQAASTATTQASSTRSALENLKIATTDPKTDTLTFAQESDMFKKFSALFEKK
jgi:hypothetical protein